MEARDDISGGPQLSPHQQKLLATYPKTIDPQLAQLLALGEVSYNLYSSLDKNTQSQIGGALMGTLGGGTADKSAAELTPAELMPYLQNSGAIPAATMKAYQANPLGYATPAQAKAAATHQGTVAQPKGTVPQPGGGGGGSNYMPGPRNITQGQLTASLKMQGYNFPFDTSKFMHDAITQSNGDMSLAQDIFMGEMIKSPQFKAYYPHIFDKSGRMNVSISQYDDYTSQVQAEARKQGFALTRSQAGQAIADNVSADEMKQRLTFARDIKQNQDEFIALNDVFKARGQKQIKTAQDAFNFLAGAASPGQYQAWNAAQAEAAAKRAGLQVGAKEALSATSKLTGFGQMADIEKAYAQIADQLKSSNVELSGYGLSQRDLETIQFGGANRDLLASRAQQALDQRQAQVQTQVTADANVKPQVAQEQATA